MRIAFLMDPVTQVLVDKDTTFALMLEAQARGHEVYYVPPTSLYACDGTVHAHVQRAYVKRAEPPEHVRLEAPRSIDLRSLHALFVRTDPPFDDQYLYVTLLLERVRHDLVIVNDPRGLREANEKLYALHFPEVTPQTLVSTREDDIREFLRQVGTMGVIKPLDGAGGRGVMLLDLADRNFRSIIETITHEGRRFCMVQEYLPAVRKGDKRVLLLDGEPLGAILRVPRVDEARSNIHVGGSVEPCELDDDDKRIIACVAPRLRADGLHFVGLDVIGGRLTEVNVTSPTGIQELARFTASNPEGKVLAWVEERVERVAGAAR
jgi:glutathione synthase